VQAFKWARQYCPRSILILNDYNNIEYAGDNNRTIDIVNRIKAAGAPIDAVARGGQTWVANSGLVTTGGTIRPAMTWLMSFLGR
jgi:endo-1,4-beta-xylanase